MQAVVGRQAPFDHGRQQLKLLTNLEITTKAVQRTAEAIGEDIVAHEQVEIQRAMQLDLPMVIGKPVPILYVPRQDRRPTGSYTGSQTGMCVHPE